MAITASGQVIGAIQRMDTSYSSEEMLYFRVGFTGPMSGYEDDFLVVSPLSGWGAPAVGNAAIDLTGSEKRLTAMVSGMPASTITVEMLVKTNDSTGTLACFAAPGSLFSEFRLHGPSDLKLRINGNVVVTGAGSIADGAWHHVAATWDGATGDATIRVDGALTTGNGEQGFTLASSGRFTVGQDQVNYLAPFTSELDAVFDEVRVWTTVRTSTQLAALDDRPLQSGNLALLALYWPLEAHEDLGVSGGPNDLRDLSANRNHGEVRPSAAPVVAGGTSAAFAIARIDMSAEACNGPVQLDFFGTAINGSGQSVFDDHVGPAYDFLTPNPAFAGVSVTSFTPTTGSCTGGDLIQFSGSGFATGAIDTVLIGNQPASAVTIVNDTTVTVIAPTPPVLNVALDVRLWGPCSNAIHLPGAFTAASSTSSITSATPMSVGCEGGATVTITGSGFQVNGVDLIDNVRFRGVDAASFTVLGPNTIEAVTPAFATPGTGFVTALSSCMPTSGLSGFTVTNSPVTLASISPTTGDCSGGDVVTVTGTGFLAGGSPRVDWVRFGGIDGSNLQILSDTQIQITTPPLPGAGIAFDVTVGGTCTPTVGLTGVFTGVTTLNVPGDYATIAEAAAHACNGTVIEVAPGTYAENGIDLGTYDVKLVGLGGAAATILDGGATGRILKASGPAEIVGFTFRNGDTSGQGGALFIEHLVGPGVLVRQCVFEDNVATSAGGAVMVKEGTARFVACDFRGNRSRTANGGGLAATVGTAQQVELVSCRFVGNDAQRGGAVLAAANAAVTVAHGTFFANAASVEAGALFVNGTCTVESSIVWANSYTTPTPSGQNAGSGTTTFTYSAVEGGAAGTGNIAGDPGLRDEDGRLRALSACVDAASPTPSIVLSALDADLCPRLEGAARDIGAAEFAPAAYPGTGEDLSLTIEVAGVALPAPCAWGGPVDVMSGDPVVLRFRSPFATFDGIVPVLAGQSFLTGAPPAGSFPGVHLSTTATPGPFILFDGNQAGGLFGPALMPPGGYDFVAAAPQLAPGTSVMLQGFSLTPTAANAIFASTNGLELRFQ